MGREYVAVDLGATKILFGILGPEGTVLKRYKMPTEAQPCADQTVDRIIAEIQALRREIHSRNQELAGIGVACPGPLAYPEAVICASPNLKWQKVPIKTILQEQLHTAVAVEKDTNMAVWGEYYFGRHSVQNMVYITVSTGIGGGIIIDGKLCRGGHGGAGEFGHMVIEPKGPLCGCGRYGCWEALASGSAIAAQANSMIRQGVDLGWPDHHMSLEAGAFEVGEAARHGNAAAQSIVERMYQYLVLGIGNVVNLFNPQLVVLGGSVIWGWKDFWDQSLSADIRKQVFTLHGSDLKVQVSALGEDVVLLGCLAALTKAY